MKSKINAEKIIELIKSRNGIETKQICDLMNITIGQWQLAQPYVKSHCYRLTKKWYMTVVDVVPPRIRKSPTATIVYRMMPVSQMGLKERLGMHKDSVWRALTLLKKHNLIHITGYETSSTTLYPIYAVGYGLDATRPCRKELANERSKRYKNKNIEMVREKHRAYRAKNREELREKSQARYAENADAINTIARLRRAVSKEVVENPQISQVATVWRKVTPWVQSGLQT
jgi:hypothetical protein